MVRVVNNIRFHARSEAGTGFCKKGALSAEHGAVMIVRNCEFEGQFYT